MCRVFQAFQIFVCVDLFCFLLCRALGRRWFRFIFMDTGAKQNCQTSQRAQRSDPMIETSSAFEYPCRLVLNSSSFPRKRESSGA